MGSSFPGWVATDLAEHPRQLNAASLNISAKLLQQLQEYFKLVS